MQTPPQPELPRIVELPEHRIRAHLQQEIKRGFVRCDDLEIVASKVNNLASCKWRPTNVLARQTEAAKDIANTTARTPTLPNAYLVLDVFLQNGLALGKGTDVFVVDQDNIGAFGIVFDKSSTDVLWIRSHKVARRVRFRSISKY